MSYIPIHKLHRHLPGHIAMNAALLVRNLRPVQIDKEDISFVPSFREAIRKVAKMKCETWDYDLGTLVWIQSRRLPSDIQRALGELERLSSSASIREIAIHTGICLGLRCSAKALFDSEDAFRVHFIVKALDESEWSFKQQMCLDPSQTSKLMKELLKYSNVADEMGFTTVEMHVVKLHSRFLLSTRAHSANNV